MTKLEDLKRCPVCHGADIINNGHATFPWRCVPCDKIFVTPYSASAAPATPAATPMAALKAGLFIARNELERLSNLAHTGHSYLAKQYCDQCKAAVNGIAAINTALQPAAAQPQRESEQPEQALRNRIVEAAARYLMAKPEEDAGDWCDAFDQLHEQVSLFYGSEDHGVWRAALSPQTDSLSTQQGGTQHG